MNPLFLVELFHVSPTSGQQFETNNSLDIFASNVCKTSLLQYIGSLFKSKLRDMIFLWFWFLWTTKLLTLILHYVRHALLLESFWKWGPNIRQKDCRSRKGFLVLLHLTFLNSIWNTKITFICCPVTWESWTVNSYALVPDSDSNN